MRKLALTVLYSLVAGVGGFFFAAAFLDRPDLNVVFALTSVVFGLAALAAKEAFGPKKTLMTFGFIVGILALMGIRLTDVPRMPWAYLFPVLLLPWVVEQPAFVRLFRVARVHVRRAGQRLGF